MVLIKYSGKYVKIYFNMKITYLQLWGIDQCFSQSSALCCRKFRLPWCFTACYILFVWKHLLELLLLPLGNEGVGVS